MLIREPLQLSAALKHAHCQFYGSILACDHSKVKTFLIRCRLTKFFVSLEKYLELFKRFILINKINLIIRKEKHLIKIKTSS